MPRLLSIDSPYPAPALLALRRTLWQLALLGAASAIAIGVLAEAPGILPIWLLLTPASALLVHHRDALLALFYAAASVEPHAGYPRRRPLCRQASRRGDAAMRRRLPRQPNPVQHVR